MSRYVVTLDYAGMASPHAIGDKFSSLARASRSGIAVPEAVCIATEAYRAFMASSGLTTEIAFELARKRFAEMRWEELWDTALRIRARFLHAPLPQDLSAAFKRVIERTFGDTPVVVRSSAPGEDSTESSFAGIHESFVNVRGTDDILTHIKLVWASLFSDKALLYRKELGIDPRDSCMAVIVQRLIKSDRSGIVFTLSPTDETCAVVEAVYGLNQGLVDGIVEPDRWILKRDSGEIAERSMALHTTALVAGSSEVREVRLQQELASQPVLQNHEVADVLSLAMSAETLANCPQDVEWTYEGAKLSLLQSRPITKRKEAPQDARRFYLGLHRSYEELERLRRDIEQRILPGMNADAKKLASEELQSLDDAGIANALARREEVFEKWKDAYWASCIPFGHGMRLFGQFYNDVVRPDDPHEFIDLLASSELLSIERNKQLAELAHLYRCDPHDSRLAEGYAAFIDNHGPLLFDTQSTERIRPQLEALVQKLSRRVIAKPIPRRQDALEKNFFASVRPKQQPFARALLALGRSSYRLRDDDNSYLGRVESELKRALQIAHARLASAGRIGAHAPNSRETVAALRNPSYKPMIQQNQKGVEKSRGLRARQLIGQPAGKGLVQARARVVAGIEDAFAIEEGEIMVCDAIDPAMTAAVALASGIVERRGGMLIHGAIIAREYGLPCVTGIPDATEYIRTGTLVTLDGTLGIVTVHGKQ